jgi:hypothetical protein
MGLCGDAPSIVAIILQTFRFVSLLEEEILKDLSARAANKTQFFDTGMSQTRNREWRVYV